MTDIIVTRPVTADYERGFAETFGERPDRFCEGCGRVKAWCECGIKAWLPDAPLFAEESVKP